MVNTPIYPYCSYEDYSWENVFSILLGNGSPAIRIYPSSLFSWLLTCLEEIKSEKLTFFFFPDGSWHNHLS